MKLTLVTVCGCVLAAETVDKSDALMLKPRQCPLSPAEVPDEIESTKTALNALLGDCTKGVSMVQKVEQALQDGKTQKEFDQIVGPLYAITDERGEINARPLVTKLRQLVRLKKWNELPMQIREKKDLLVRQLTDKMPDGHQVLVADVVTRLEQQAKGDEDVDLTLFSADDLNAVATEYVNLLRERKQVAPAPVHKAKNKPSAGSATRHGASPAIGGESSSVSSAEQSVLPQFRIKKAELLRGGKTGPRQGAASTGAACARGACAALTRRRSGSGSSAE